jgi:signal transduction histidine kinase
MSDDIRMQMALEELDGDDAEARLAAITQLGEVGDRSLAAKLVGLLREDDPAVRAAAEETLRKIGGLPIVQALLELLHDDSLPDRMLVITLGEDLIKAFAREVHDGLAAKLAAAVMQLTIIERLLTRDPERVASEIQELKQLTSLASQEARNIIMNLKR